MLRRSVVVGLAMLAVAFMVGTGITGGDPKKIKGQLPAGWKKLELSKEQTLKIYTIRTQYRLKIKMLEVQVEGLRSQEKTELIKVLTEDQKEKLRKMILGETPPKDKKTVTKDKDKDKDR